MKVMTGIFGEVEIREVFEDELEARAAGYVYDGAAYRVNDFGAVEPVSWKVLARDTDFVHKDYALIKRRK